MVVVVLEEVLVIVVVVVLLEVIVSVLGELVVELVVVSVLEELVVGLLMVLVVVVEGLEVEGLVKGLYPDPLPSPGPIQHQTSAPLLIASNQMICNLPQHRNQQAASPRLGWEYGAAPSKPRFTGLACVLTRFHRRGDASEATLPALTHYHGVSLCGGASNQHTPPQASSRPDLGSSDPLTGGSTGEEGPPAVGPRRVWRLEAEGGSLCSPPVNPFPIQLLP
ncbi:unnamed protein product [Boreogadus saida]